MVVVRALSGETSQETESGLTHCSARTTDRQVDVQTTSNHKKDRSLRKQKDKQAVRRYLEGKQCYRTSLSEYLDSTQDRRWCMAEDIACDVCKVVHADRIKQPESTEDSRVHTGLQVMQQERLREQTELEQYRLDLASVRDLCLLCKAMRGSWDHAFSKCPRRHEVFREKNEARKRHEKRGRMWIQPYTSCFWCLNP